jgi:uncharacterized protein
MNDLHWFEDGSSGRIGYHAPTGRLVSETDPDPLPEFENWDDLHAATETTTDLAMDLSGSCNLNCVYCFEHFSSRTRGPVSRATIEAALDDLFSNAEASPLINLHFSSGETLLRFDLLRNVVEQALSRADAEGKRVAFYLNTNGTLLSKTIAKFLKEHYFLVRISFDGPDRRHDALRPAKNGAPTSRKARRGLDLLLRHMPARFVVNAVLPTGDRLGDVWRWARGEGIPFLHVIKISAARGAGLALSAADLPAYRADLAAIARDLASEAAHGQPKTRLYTLNTVIWNHMRKIRKLRNCGAGGTLLNVASDGKLYPCYRLLGHESACFGHVASLDAAHLKDLRKQWFEYIAPDVDNRPVCRQCWARYLCGGGCYADSLQFGDSHTAPFDDHCPFIKAEIEEALRLYHTLSSTPCIASLANLFDHDTGPP